MRRIRKWTLTWTALCLSTVIWTGSVNGQDLDPNELVEVRRGDIAKCRAMAERWEEKSRACALADGKRLGAEQRANDLYQKNVELIERSTRLETERDAYKALALAGAAASTALLLFIVFAPN